MQEGREGTAWVASPRQHSQRVAATFFPVFVGAYAIRLGESPSLKRPGRLYMPAVLATGAIRMLCVAVLGRAGYRTTCSLSAFRSGEAEWSLRVRQWQKGGGTVMDEHYRSGAPQGEKGRARLPDISSVSAGGKRGHRPVAEGAAPQQARHRRTVGRMISVDFNDAGQD